MNKETTGRKSKYAKKKIQMQNGTYSGNSPFYENLPEFQHYKPLHSYPHLKGLRADQRNDQNYSY